KRPVVPKAVSEHIVDAYVQSRQNGKADRENGQEFTYVSARTLLGVLRLAQAMARLRFSDEVSVEDVNEALRLVDVSKASLYDHDGSGQHGDGNGKTYSSPTDRIYNIIRTMSKDPEDNWRLVEELRLQDIRDRVLAKGFKIQELEDCLREYEEMNIWFVNDAQTKLTWITRD
ncbi:Mcm2-7 hexameric complex component, partial [Lobosporangium transversale]